MTVAAFVSQPAMHKQIQQMRMRIKSPQSSDPDFLAPAIKTSGPAGNGLRHRLRPVHIVNWQFHYWIKPIIHKP